MYLHGLHALDVTRVTPAVQARDLLCAAADAVFHCFLVL